MIAALGVAGPLVIGQVLDRASTDQMARMDSSARAFIMAEMTALADRARAVQGDAAFICTREDAAFHEAGHAVYEAAAGQPVSVLKIFHETVGGRRSWLGHTTGRAPWSVTPQSSPGADLDVARMVIAGMMGELVCQRGNYRLGSRRSRSRANGNSVALIRMEGIQSSMAVARRHHFIPRCYLKGFAAPRKKKRQVTVFDRVDGRSFPTAIENVAVEKDFNRVEIEGHLPDAFEAELAKFEGEAAPALERAIAARSIREAQDRAYVLNLMGLVAVRNPRQRENMRQVQEQIVRVTGEMVTATPEIWQRQIERARAAGFLTPSEGDIADDYEQMKEFIDKGEYRVEVPTERHIEQEMRMFETILPLLDARRWMLVRANEDTGNFVTSDNPVCLMWSDPARRGRGPYSPGFGLRETQVVFPISHQVAIMGAFEIEEEEREGDDALVAAINSAVIAHAERHVYARDMHFKYSVDWRAEPRKASRLASEKWFRQNAVASDRDEGGVKVTE